jgi:hypothetical protein
MWSPTISARARLKAVVVLRRHTSIGFTYSFPAGYENRTSIKGY